MTKTPVQLSFEEYLTYDDGTDNRYELIDGKLVIIPLPTGDRSDVIDFLSDTFRAEISKQGQTWIVKRDAGVYIGINLTNGKDRSRTPDLCVVTQAQWAKVKADKTRAAVLRDAPLLVVEIVSPSSKKIDYQTKEQEYKTIGIPEYWIVDFQKSQITILLLKEGEYERREFFGTERIVSLTFPELILTPQQILTV
ncbi:Uma2 family endonuclease [Dendronalium sp. ChiSLP03b]|uniref:Uma2 family endonuclease n=1 Tax=Dendronalium sp. ChiSLP03b TaxID=3075381 RepID=UPI002AD29C98|nr:Uma2 family endonuclease [Dendronalium sp. ChiSLP03b]MDZ8204188.1 Uma2 family endonuclease [Dendronalium sp. ChiSLP03b]